MSGATIVSNINKNVSIINATQRTLITLINGTNINNYRFYCNSTDICKIGCQSEYACSTMELYCYGTCYVACGVIKSIDCPTILFGRYSNWDTDAPSPSPTFIPSNDPTNMPSHSVSPTAVPTDVPSDPTNNPIFIIIKSTTESPSNMPTDLVSPTSTTGTDYITSKIINDTKHASINITDNTQSVETTIVAKATTTLSVTGEDVANTGSNERGVSIVIRAVVAHIIVMIVYV